MKVKKLCAIFLLLTISCTRNSSQEFKEKEMDLAKIKALADSSYERNSYEAALTYLDQLILADSLNGEFFYKRAYSYAQLSDFKKSSNDYHRAAALGYRVSDSYYNLGLNQIPSLNDTLAIFYFEKSLEINPHSSEIISAMEACKKRLNSLDKRKTSI